MTKIDRDKIIAAGDGVFLPSRTIAMWAVATWALTVVNLTLTLFFPSAIAITSTFATALCAMFATAGMQRDRSRSFYYLRKWGYLDDAKDSQ